MRLPPVISSFLAVALVTVRCAAAVPSGGFEEQFDLADRSELGAVLCVWSETGLAVRVAYDGCTNTVRITPRATVLEGSLDARLLQPPPPVATNRAWLAFKRLPHAWTLYLADAPVARFAEASAGAVSLALDASALPEEEARDSYTQRLGAFRFDDTFMIPEGETLSAVWEPITGAWSLHTVTNDLESLIGNVRPERAPTPARSPNFYSLQGSGAAAVILAGEPFRDSYAVRAAVQHNEGTNGLVFLATEAGDCHGFTARTDPETEHVVLELWRGRVDDPGARRVLDAFQTDLTPGQWLQLEAVVFDDRVILLADGIELLRRPCSDLPPGGRYGLFADAAAGTRFDDFTADSHQDYPFDCAADALAATRRRVGAVAVRAFGDGAATLGFGGGEHLWRFGADTDAPHRLSVRFLLSRGDLPATLGLLAGGGNPGEPGWRFACRVSATNRVFSLVRLDGTNTVVIDQATLPATGRDIRLTLDALRPDELRAFADDALVLFHRTDLPLGGSGAITVSSAAPVSAALPEYTTRSVSFADRFEKNLLYVNDPFMRHWASPEGQWHTAQDGRTWLRGDMIRRVRIRMPATPEPSVIHLAADEEGSNAVCRVECRDGLLRGYVSALGEEARFEVAVTNVPLQTFEGDIAHRLYTVGLEDHVFWLGDDTRLLASAHLSAPAGGRRIRIEGFDEKSLRFSLVRRENVFDTLFNESLQNWTLNGGRWEVVNRFQCQPMWSHMNGENDNSLAALWSKFDFAGDFCAELYAGMRHGRWYQRVGDLNLTVLSQRGATCDGYTATVTGWDPDHSQNATRLFRNGVAVTNTDSYLLPRIREGNVRRGGYEPMVPGGRDVHGAWYGIRLRRTGNRVQLVYDNLPAIEYTDSEPLAGGCFGIWTFRNSMMVARVRIAAESIRPRRFAFRAIDPAAPPAPAPAAGAFSLPPQTANGLPVNMLTSACWTADDPVSRPVVRFRGSGDAAEMRVAAHHGGGTFFVSNSVPPIAASRLLGWRFDVARSADAAFNLEFTTGRIAEGAFAAVQPWSFVISGADDTRGPRRIAGRCDVPPASTPGAPVWTTVYAWLPCEVLSSDLVVQAEGFGNLQPSDVQQGLLGNAPGAWYAIRRFRPVLRGRPELGGIDDREAFAAATAAIAALPPAQLNTFTLPPAADPAGAVIEWAVPPDADFGLEAGRDPDFPDTATIRATTPWNSPLLPPRTVQVDGIPAAFTVGNAVMHVLLPRRLENPRPVLSAELADGRIFTQTLSPPPAAPGTAPVLLVLELPEGRLTTFEERSLDAGAFAAGANANLLRADAGRGMVLQIANRGAATRLAARLAPAYDPLLTPLVQFAYRAEPMARFSLVSGRSQMTFTEPWGLSATIAGPPVADGSWQVWLGSPLMAVSESRIAEGFAFPPSELLTGSRHGYDQSGLYSTLLLDDLAFGPAVGPSRILAFRAVFDDAEGDLAAVEYALLPGPQPWALRPAAAQQAAVWLTATNAEVTTPAVTAMDEGIHHLVVRARDAAGNPSAVADLPFMLDRTPPAVGHAVVATESYNKTCVNLTLEGGLAIPSLRSLQLTCNGAPLNLASDNGRAFLSASGIRLEIDWPWLLRRSLQTAKHGDRFILAFAGITDIAGNAVPRFEIPITLDTANDKTPPSVLALERPGNVNAWMPLLANPAEFFHQIQTDGMESKTAEDGSLVAEFKTFENGSAVLRRNYRTEPGWETDKHGWFGLSLRTLPGDSMPAPVVQVHFTPRALPEKAAKPKRGGAYTLTLATVAHPAVSGAVTWKAGEWQNILINVHAFLRAETGIEAVPDIRGIAVAFPDKRSRVFQIRSVALLAPYGEKDIVRFRAYDVSGIAGISWSGGRSDRLAIRPSQAARLQHAAWLDIRVADRSGNRSPVYMIPVPPVPLPGNPPAEVAGED